MKAEHEFQTVNGETVTVTLHNTLRAIIKYRVLSGDHAGSEHHDAALRSDFCWYAARVANVEGSSWRPPMEKTTPEKFDKSYHDFADMVDFETFQTCVKAANEMFTRTDEIEKPDHALTEEQQADPNS